MFIFCFIKLAFILNIVYVLLRIHSLHTMYPMNLLRLLLHLPFLPRIKITFCPSSTPPFSEVPIFIFVFWNQHRLIPGFCSQAEMAIDFRVLSSALLYAWRELPAHKD